MGSGISVRASIRAGVTHVNVTGELDLSTGGEFEAAIDQLHGRQVHLRLDLSQLEFMDAAGLHSLERVVNSSPPGWLLIEPRLQPQVRCLLRLAQAERLLRTPDEPQGAAA